MILEGCDHMWALSKCLYITTISVYWVCHRNLLNYTVYWWKCGNVASPTWTALSHKTVTHSAWVSFCCWLLLMSFYCTDEFFINVYCLGFRDVATMSIWFCYQQSLKSKTLLPMSRSNILGELRTITEPLSERSLLSDVAKHSSI